MNLHNGKQQINYEYFSRAYERRKLSHAYIIEGYGKEAFAGQTAALLMCQNPLRNPDGTLSSCGKCPACIKTRTGNHPDVITVRHEKPTVLSVNEIRNQVVSDISIVPYYGPYKLYIIPDADLMNESAQNALLKTIEEPEGYAVIFLLSDNADGFLQTIRSRCITIRMEREAPEALVKRLTDETGERVLEILMNSARMNALEINRAAKELEAMDKSLVIKLSGMWFRDVLVFKSTSSDKRLFFSQKKDMIAEIARSSSYEGLNRILDCIEEAQDRLDASVKAEAVYESMLLAVRQNQSDENNARMD